MRHAGVPYGAFCAASGGLSSPRTRKSFIPFQASPVAIERSRKNYELIREAKNAPCTDCGGTFPQEVMDLDHVRGVKLFNLSNSGQRCPENVIAEIAKCDLVCSNCHRSRTKSRAKGTGMC